MPTTYQCKLIVRLNGETHTQFGNVYTHETPAILESLVYEADFLSFGCKVESEILVGNSDTQCEVNPREVGALLFAESN